MLTMTHSHFIMQPSGVGKKPGWAWIWLTLEISLGSFFQRNHVGYPNAARQVGCYEELPFCCWVRCRIIFSRLFPLRLPWRTRFLDVSCSTDSSKKHFFFLVMRTYTRIWIPVVSKQLMFSDKRQISVSCHPVTCINGQFRRGRFEYLFCSGVIELFEHTIQYHYCSVSFFVTDGGIG
jgi:hypothetical protein